jgi:hypothetical protein
MVGFFDGSDESSNPIKAWNFLTSWITTRFSRKIL